MTAKRIATQPYHPHPHLSLEGKLLVAAPNWDNQLFGRSVCMVVHHSEQGAVGIFLNRCMDLDAAGLWQQLTGQAAAEQHGKPIHFGGPKSGPVVVMHNRADLAEFRSAEGVYFAAQLPHLQELLKLTDSDAALKIIVGQAAWPAGVLDAEFAAGNWLPLPVLPQLVFTDGPYMWAKAIREVANRYVVGISGAHGQPDDILAN